MMRRLTQLTAVLALVLGLVFFTTRPDVNAYTAGQPGRLTLSPASSTATTGQQFTVDVKMNTGGQAISGVAMRLTYPVPATPDLEVVSITPNNSLGWSFPFPPSAYVSGGKMFIDLAGATAAPAGYTATSDVTLATITFRANTAFSGKQLTFDQTQSVMTKKTDASDVLGTLGTGTVTASGGSVTPNVPTPSPTPTTSTVTPTPTPTPTTSSTTTNPSPTPTTSTTSTTTNTTTTTTTTDTSGVGGTTEDTRTTVASQSQPQPVSGSVTTTLAVIGLGVAMVVGALYLRFRPM